MIEKKIALPPFPIYGRIPNFKGADKAAEKIRLLKEYLNSKVILCNPDSPQRPIREIILKDGKLLIVATPRLSKGFMLIEKSSNPYYDSTIRGILEKGKLVKPGDYEIDLFIAGSVAVTPKGYRLGKGKGFSDIEYKIWKDYMNENLIKITSVHDIQVVDYVPVDEWDVPMDVILTPTRIIWSDKSEAKRSILY
ncbi:MAG: 5-formyltetrahydrofolate cyclo-ligase [Candidatus Methanomethylicota archaeon]|jgi:5-formyltetrahydrofolate cyclo-ligase|uniref:5-formyltetrahydrofolate cyclo-ligase n=1 Tax=Thermoproteota archaeon TaxID=2056631 RepID=A0A520KHM8_9CREN|nr:MAG: 5-formyltetrahydrofolate cyclo-ligase [Candidatus Verstraetearchaeota archaeon]TDA38327.1 MAG: 5-formyltetrahydrofolate cyclo-ligase [Candidatus Verstraetearchaeota archaeon]